MLYIVKAFEFQTHNLCTHNYINRVLTAFFSQFEQNYNQIWLILQEIKCFDGWWCEASLMKPL